MGKFNVVEWKDIIEGTGEERLYYDPVAGDIVFLSRHSIPSKIKERGYIKIPTFYELTQSKNINPLELFANDYPDLIERKPINAIFLKTDDAIRKFEDYSNELCKKLLTDWAKENNIHLQFIAHEVIAPTVTYDVIFRQEEILC